METRSGIDGQLTSHDLSSSPTVIEWKCPPGTPHRLTPLWINWLVPLRNRWIQLAPLCFLLLIGAWVPGFLTTLALLLVSLVAALAAFVVCVQLPLGYLVRYWRGIRRGDPARREATDRASSSGI